MTTKIALWFGALILATVGLDYLVFGADHLVFLARKGFALIEWLAFWR